MSTEDGRKIYDHDVSTRNPETARMAAAARQAEEEAVRRMGYNPFKPHMSFSGAGPTSTPAAAAAAGSSSGTNSVFSTPGVSLGSGGNSPRAGSAPASTAGSDDADVDLYAESRVDDADVDTVNEALGQLLSAAESDPQLVQNAVTTACKMLKALVDNKNEAKFRSIRLGNAAFQSKVVACPGGLELFMAAGFTLETEADGAAGGEQEAFLRHCMSGRAEGQLRYTLMRIKDMQ